MNVVVDSRYGKIVVNSNDRYLSRSLIEYGEFSEGEAQLFKQIIKPDWIVCDVGANFGAHTLLFSKLAKHVYAFEPQRCVFKALCETVKLNGLTNVDTIQAAIGDGATVKYRDIDSSVENNFGSFSFVGNTEGEDIQTFTLNIPCHFLKIDVEGMELEVLKGAEQMIKDCKPCIYLENDRPEKSDILIMHLENLGYDCYWDTPKLFNPDNFFKKTEDIFPDLASINMLCVLKGTNMGEAQRAKLGEWNDLFVTGGLIH